MDPIPDDKGENLFQLQALREQVAALQASLDSSYRLGLSPVQPRSFLGQPVTLIATVTDRRGQRPRAGLPLTLVTTWGKLQLPGKDPQTAGQTLTTVSGPDGTARIILVPPTGEDILPPQQAALEVMLRNLDPKAPTPAGAKKGLVEMVEQYRWEINADFRSAVDVYFTDMGLKLLETVNSQDFMGDWMLIPVTVLAYTAEAGGTVAASAVLPLTFKNWLGPWLQAYREITEKANPLESDLEDLEKKGTEPVTVLNNIYEFVQTYVSGERGKAGQYLGRQIAQDSLHKLLDTGLDKLPLATRIAIFPAVQATGQVVAQVGLSAAAVAHQTEATLSHQVIGKGRLIELGDIVNRLNDAEAQLANTVDREALINALTSKVDQQALTDALANKIDQQILTQALATRVSQETLTAALASKADQVALTAVIADKVDTVTFNNALADKVDTVALNTALADRVDTATFNNTLAGKISTGEFKDALANKVDTTTFTAFADKVDVDKLNDSLSGKVDKASFERFQGKLDERLTGLIDRDSFAETLKGLATKEDLAKLSRDIGRKIDTAIITDALAQKADLSQVIQLQNDLTTRLDAKADATRLNQVQTDLQSRINSKADLTEINQLSSTVNTRLNTLNDNVTVIRRKVFQ